MSYMHFVTCWTRIEQRSPKGKFGNVEWPPVGQNLAGNRTFSRFGRPVFGHRPKAGQIVPLRPGSWWGHARYPSGCGQAGGRLYVTLWNCLRTKNSCKEDVSE